MISIESIICRLVSAVILGGMVGLERERLVRAAGLRTHALVCLGAALFMIVSAFGFTDILGYPHVDLDPSRIAAQVVTGIGFLGAGTIIFQQGSVRGLTTAASIWAVAAVGLAVGGGMYLVACIATFLALVILVVVKPLERRIDPPDHYAFVIVVSRESVTLSAIYASLEAAKTTVVRIVVTPHITPNEDRLELLLPRIEHPIAVEIAESLRHVAGVNSVQFTEERFVLPENR